MVSFHLFIFFLAIADVLVFAPVLLSVFLCLVMDFLILSFSGNNFKQYLEIDNRIVKCQIHNLGWYNFASLQ